MFKQFKEEVQNRFNNLHAQQDVLFITNIDKDVLWEVYLNSFPPKTRQEYNCNSCKQFIRNYGNVVAIINNKIETIWNVGSEASTEFEFIAGNMNRLVSEAPIKDVFVSDIIKLGTDKNTQTLENGSVIIWDHFFIQLPRNLANLTRSSNESLMGTYRDTRNAFARSLDSITTDACNIVLELINANNLYRGQEFKSQVQLFLNNLISFNRILINERDNWVWSNFKTAPASVTNIRNSVIGTLLVDISEGKDLEQAVRSYESKVAPTNYKRPSAIVTASQVAQAEATIIELNLKNSLNRRYATADDITIGNVLYLNRDKNLSNVFTSLKEDIVVNPNSFKNIEEISIDSFIKDVLPGSNNVELLLENRHLSNLMSLVTAKEDSPLMFKWNNPFSWSYINALTDSLKEKVKQAGGNVEGALRFSIQWNEKGDSICDLDAHATGPEGQHIYFSTYKGRTNRFSGMLDVDMIRPSDTGVENITWLDESKMPEGVYSFYVNNYDGGPNTGFRAQIEFNGQIYDFNYNKRATKDVVVAKVKYSKAKGFEIVSSLETNESVSSKNKWNLDTNKFHKVSMILNSPNHWDEQIGNKHTFFILDNAISDESPRPFFNEFLRDELLQHHKRVFEILGSRIKVEQSNDQLSGVGFSSTQSNSFIVRVTGQYQRTIKVKM